VITEHALLAVTPGHESAFEAAMAQALVIITSAPGCHGATVSRQLEDPSQFLLLVQWESVAAHTEEFRSSELFEKWRALTHPFYVERPVVTHFDSPIQPSS
jgi:quinol monooxygenase YgiN